MKIRIYNASGVLVGLALTLLITTVTHVDKKHPIWFMVVLGSSLVIGVEIEDMISKPKG